MTSLSTLLSNKLEDIESGGTPNPPELGNLWLANCDARSHAIVGTPAVLLPLAQDGTS